MKTKGRVLKSGSVKGLRHFEGQLNSRDESNELERFYLGFREPVSGESPPRNKSVRIIYLLSRASS